MTHILVLEDDEANRLTLEGLLEDEGYSVVAVHSVAAARDALARPDADFAVALLDFNLGDGLGTELIPTLRARSTKAVVISGTAGPEAATERADAWLEKGGSVDDLLALVRDFSKRG